MKRFRRNYQYYNPIAGMSFSSKCLRYPYMMVGFNNFVIRSTWLMTNEFVMFRIVKND